MQDYSVLAENAAEQNMEQRRARGVRAWHTHSHTHTDTRSLLSLRSEE
jgi:hypothetical protein